MQRLREHSTRWGPVTLVGRSYGGHVITNAAYNNPNVTGLVYIASNPLLLDLSPVADHD